MLRSRIEKLEARLPLPSGLLLERLERRARLSLPNEYRALLSQLHRVTNGRLRRTAEHLDALERYGESFELLLEEISDSDLGRLLAEVDRTTNWNAL
jgi:hypothetical protein